MRISDWSSDVCSSISECVAAQDVTRAVTDALVLLFGEGAGDDADGVSELGNDRIVRREVFLSDRVGVALDERRAPHLQNGSDFAVVADRVYHRSAGGHEDGLRHGIFFLQLGFENQNLIVE